MNRSRFVKGSVVLISMPAMPSKENMCKMSNGNNAPEFNISSKEVEELVFEIKENLRLSASSMKALPCSQLSRKSSRASPYRVPGRNCLCDSTTSCDQANCSKKNRRKIPQENPDDPYELLQKLLRDGGLVQEAVRRVQLGLSPKQRYFYESDEESSPVLRLCSQENCSQEGRCN